MLRRPIRSHHSLERLPLLLRAGQLLPLYDAGIETLVDTDVPGIVDAGDVADVYDVDALLEAGKGVSAGPGRLQVGGLLLVNQGKRRVRWELYLVR